jgi:hypothetical protein
MNNVAFSRAVNGVVLADEDIKARAPFKTSLPYKYLVIPHRLTSELLDS